MQAPRAGLLRGQACSHLGPLEGFTTRLSISTYGGIILALPVILWQIWRFIVPALHAKEKKYAIPFVLSLGRCCSCSAAFVAYWTLDKALEFLISWAGPRRHGRRSRSASTSASSG